MILRELLATFGINYSGDGEKKAEAALRGLQGQAQAVGGALQTFGQAFAASGILLAFKDWIGVASGVEEGLVRVRAVFGEAAGGVEAWMKGASDALGRGGDELGAYAATLGMVVGQFTDGEAATAALSQSLTETAVNMAAFTGTTDDEAINALRMGIMGSDRALKRFGIQLDDDALKEFALSQGIRRSVKDMSEKEKALLRIKKIQAATAKMEGAAAKATQRYAGAVRFLQVKLNDLKTALGQELLGPATALVTWMRQGLTWFLRLAETSNSLKGALVGLALAATAMLAPALLKILLLVGPLLLAFAIFAIIMDDVITAFTGGNSAFRGFAEWCDRMEKEGFPGLGIAAEAAIAIFNRFRDALGIAAFAVATFFEGLLTGDWKSFNETTTMIKESFDAMFESLGRWGYALRGYVKAVLLPLKTLGGLVVAIAQAITTGSLDPLKGVLSGIGKDFGEIKGDVFSAVNGTEGFLGSEATATAAPRTLDAAGLETRAVSVTEGDKVFNMQITQLPGEDSEEFAKRVAEITQGEFEKYERGVGLQLGYKYRGAY